jgi:hypothetical protein
MSIKVSSLVRKFGPHHHSNFVVLLALADHANDAGTDCWPSVKAISFEMRIGKSSVIRSLKTLANDGWITVMRKSREHKGNSYRIALEKLRAQESDATLTPEVPESDATPTPEITKSGANEFTVRCHTGKSQVSPSPLSGVKSASLFKNCPEPSENRPEQSKRSSSFVLPDWVPAEQWKHFIEMRASKRNKPTAHAAKLLITKLDQFRSSGQDPGDVLDQSTANGWMGIFPLKGNSNGNLPLGKSDANLAVLAESLARSERKDRAGSHGLLSAGDDGRDDA